MAKKKVAPKWPDVHSNTMWSRHNNCIKIIKFTLLLKL